MIHALILVCYTICGVCFNTKILFLCLFKKLSSRWLPEFSAALTGNQFLFGEGAVICVCSPGSGPQAVSKAMPWRGGLRARCFGGRQLAVRCQEPDSQAEPGGGVRGLGRSCGQLSTSICVGVKTKGWFLKADWQGILYVVLRKIED